MARRAMIERIVIETKRLAFPDHVQVRMDDLVLEQNLTAAQAHLIVGECWTGSRCRALKKAFRETLTGQPCGEALGRSASPMPRPGQERIARAAHFSPVILGPLNG
jgi:hypothetical protein